MELMHKVQKFMLNMVACVFFRILFVHLFTVYFANVSGFLKKCFRINIHLSYVVISTSITPSGVLSVNIIH